MTPPATRVERDLLGARDVPADAYWGVHTLRALENFPISGIPMSVHPAVIRALAVVKHAAALANRDLGLLSEEKASAIVVACVAVRAGELDAEFPVDVIQGGAGTSTNMNANEVLANRGLEALGHQKGAYEHLHPVEDVNQGQSTNDVYPTAVKMAIDESLGELILDLRTLASAFERKAVEFEHIVKVGRTQLQDAVPMTLGREFHAFSVTLGEEELRIEDARRLLREIHLGGTAVGTGIAAHPLYSSLALNHLRSLWGGGLVVAHDFVEATQDAGVFVQVSGVLKRIAVKLSKICNDLRLLSSGPQAGFGEIRLPAMQAGSSIMPGKVNPVIPEVVNQIAFEIIGNDVTITMAAEAGQLQLNAFEPVMVHKLLDGIAHLRAGSSVLAMRCVGGITVNSERVAVQVEASLGIAAALNAHIGYERASELAALALASGRPFRDVLTESHVLAPDVLDAILNPSVAATSHRAERSA